VEVISYDKKIFSEKSTVEDQSFEDFALDYEKGIAYMSGDDRTWWPTFSLFKHPKKQGKMFTFDIQSETFKRLNLINYPYEDFHPLGIGLLKRKTDQVR
jgi:hypothetical protein